MWRQARHSLLGPHLDCDLDRNGGIEVAYQLFDGRQRRFVAEKNVRGSVPVDRIATPWLRDPDGAPYFTSAKPLRDRARIVENHLQFERTGRVVIERGEGANDRSAAIGKAVAVAVPVNLRQVRGTATGDPQPHTRRRLFHPQVDKISPDQSHPRHVRREIRHVPEFGKPKGRRLRSDPPASWRRCHAVRLSGRFRAQTHLIEGA